FFCRVLATYRFKKTFFSCFFPPTKTRQVRQATSGYAISDDDWQEMFVLLSSRKRRHSCQIDGSPAPANLARCHGAR
ncbi:MAG: hypothetical protein QGF59_11150, partial [Pirellulaceae bacterium]|nr:hypothetical protein [Pirellulaceae bacterium]